MLQAWTLLRRLRSILKHCRPNGPLRRVNDAGESGWCSHFPLIKDSNALQSCSSIIESFCSWKSGVNERACALSEPGPTQLQSNSFSLATALQLAGLTSLQPPQPTLRWTRPMWTHWTNFQLTRSSVGQARFSLRLFMYATGWHFNLVCFLFRLMCNFDTVWECACWHEEVH